MNLLELFDSRGKKKKLSHIKNLLILAACDRKLDKAEMDLIIRIANRVGINRSEIEKIGNNSSSILFFPPDNDHERLEQLYDLVLVMMVDGEIRDIELAICSHTAGRLGFELGEIDKLIQTIIALINKGATIKEVIQKIETGISPSDEWESIESEFSGHEKETFQILVSRLFLRDNIDIQKFKENIYILNNLDKTFVQGYGTYSIRRVNYLSPRFPKMFIAAYPDVYIWHLERTSSNLMTMRRPTDNKLIERYKYFFRITDMEIFRLTDFVYQFQKEGQSLECAMI